MKYHCVKFVFNPLTIQIGLIEKVLCSLLTDPLIDHASYNAGEIRQLTITIHLFGLLLLEVEGANEKTASALQAVINGRK